MTEKEESARLLAEAISCVMNCAGAVALGHATEIDDDGWRHFRRTLSIAVGHLGSPEASLGQADWSKLGAPAARLLPLLENCPTPKDVTPELAGVASELVDAFLESTSGAATQFADLMSLDED